MAAFLYYVSGDTAPTKESLCELGFPFADEAGLPGCACVGPDGQRGHVFALQEPPGFQGERPRVGYYVDRQAWKLAYNRSLWVGWETAKPPKPVDLQRKDIVTGHRVRMLDGNDWLVPVARQLTGTPAVGRVFGLDGAGNNGRTVHAKHAALWDLAKRIWDTMFTEADDHIGDDDCLTAVSLALSINYRLGEQELRALELVSDEELAQCVRAIVDYPTLEAFLREQDAAQKKTRGLEVADTTSGTSGGGD